MTTANDGPQPVRSSDDVAPGPLTAIRAADAQRIFMALDDNKDTFERLFRLGHDRAAQQLPLTYGKFLLGGKSRERGTYAVLSFKGQEGGWCPAHWIGGIFIGVQEGRENLQVNIYLPESDDPTDPRVRAGQLQMQRIFKDDAKPGVERETLRKLRVLVDAVIDDVQHLVTEGSRN